LSVNKSQGQEEESVLLDLRNQLFSHGHLYVALSRVRDASKIAIFTKKNSTVLGPNGESIAIATNIVYPELLEPVGITKTTHETDTWEYFDRVQLQASAMVPDIQDSSLSFDEAWTDMIENS